MSQIKIYKRNDKSSKIKNIAISILFSSWSIQTETLCLKSKCFLRKQRLGDHIVIRVSRLQVGVKKKKGSSVLDYKNKIIFFFDEIITFTPFIIIIYFCETGNSPLVKLARGPLVRTRTGRRGPFSRSVEDGRARRLIPGTSSTSQSFAASRVRIFRVVVGTCLCERLVRVRAAFVSRPDRRRRPVKGRGLAGEKGGNCPRGTRSRTEINRTTSVTRTSFRVRVFYKPSNDKKYREKTNRVLLLFVPCTNAVLVRDWYAETSSRRRRRDVRFFLPTLSSRRRNKHDARKTRRPDER